MGDHVTIYLSWQRTRQFKKWILYRQSKKWMYSVHTVQGKMSKIDRSTYLSLKNIILHIVHDEIIFSPLKNHSVASIKDLRKQMYKFDWTEWMFSHYPLPIAHFKNFTSFQLRKCIRTPASKPFPVKLLTFEANGPHFKSQVQWDA